MENVIDMSSHGFFQKEQRPPANPTDNTTGQKCCELSINENHIFEIGNNESLTEHLTHL